MYPKPHVLFLFESTGRVPSPLQAFANDPIGGKGQVVGQVVQGEKAGVQGVGARGELSSNYLAPKPHAHGVPAAVVKIGQGVEHRPYADFQPGFLENLPAGAFAHVLVPFQVAAGNAPHALVGAFSFDQQQPALFHDDDGHAHRGISVLDVIAGMTDFPADAVGYGFFQAFAAFWAEVVQHKGRSFCEAV